MAGRALLVAAAAHTAQGLDNGVGLRPIRGWLSWARYACNVDCAAEPGECISEALYMRVADALVANGWRDAGYAYVAVDDCWSARERDARGRIVADPARFPSGMRALADYVHARGLRFQLYTDVGPRTCTGYPALNVPSDARGGAPDSPYRRDLAQFADWGVDALKVDGCNSAPGSYAQTYPRVSAALNATGRRVVLSCSWPAYRVGRVGAAEWAQIARSCNSWRAFHDITDSWAAVLATADFWRDVSTAGLMGGVEGPGAFADADMLVGGGTGLSPSEAAAQAALWAVFASPWLLSADLARMPPWATALLQNPELLAVQSDWAAEAGPRAGAARAPYARCLAPCPRAADGGVQRWHRPLSGGRHALALLNAGTGVPGTPARVRVRWSELAPPRAQAGEASTPDARQRAHAYDVRDALRRVDAGKAVGGGLEVRVPPSSCALLVLTPAPANRSSSRSHTRTQAQYDAAEWETAERGALAALRR